MVQWHFHRLIFSFFLSIFFGCFLLSFLDVIFLFFLSWLSFSFSLFLGCYFLFLTFLDVIFFFLLSWLFFSFSYFLWCYFVFLSFLAVLFFFFHSWLFFSFSFFLGCHFLFLSFLDVIFFFFLSWLSFSFFYPFLVIIFNFSFILVYYHLSLSFFLNNIKIKKNWFWLLSSEFILLVLLTFYLYWKSKKLFHEILYKYIQRKSEKFENFNNNTANIQSHRKYSVDFTGSMHCTDRMKSYQTLTNKLLR